MLSITRIVHDILRPRIFPGGLVVDATTGNGNDTLFLAQCVGDEGEVFSFDIQPQALDRCRSLLMKEDRLECVHLFLADHQDIARHLPQQTHGRFQAILFNLGYLPESDHQCTTQAASTRNALKASLPLLAKGGILSIVCYPGHPEGAAEAHEVERWSQQLPGSHYSIITLCPANRLKPAPFALLIQRER